MPLPYTKVFTPLDELPAQDLNDLQSNDTALAAGTGLDDGAVKAIKIDFTTLPTTGSYAGGSSTLGNSSISIPQGVGGILVGYVSGRNTATGDNIMTGTFSGTGVTQIIGALSVTSVQYTTKTGIAIASLDTTHGATVTFAAGQSNTSDQTRQGWFLIPTSVNPIN